MSLADRLRNRTNDLPMDAEHLMDEAADTIKELVDALETALLTLQETGDCGSDCMSCAEANAIIARANA